MNAVSFRDAAVRLGGRTVWEHVTLDVAAGDFVAVLGPNGAGKSTLLRAVLGLQPVTAGSLTVLGHRGGMAGGSVGYLPQRRAFDTSLRIRGRDLIRLGLDGARWGIPIPFSRRSRQAARQVQDAIDRVGARELAGRPVGELSGGEQQRVLIAQALVTRPRLLLLDEPLEGLDLPNQGAIAALIGRVCRQESTTVLMVAHDVNPILDHVDGVIYLGAGGAVAGRPDQVITSDTLTALYATPVEVLHASDGRLVVVGHQTRHATAAAT